MTIFFIISSLITLSYVLLIGRFTYGWYKMPLFHPQTPTHHTSISIICPCKNERNHLPYLFQAINEQTYQHFELILVNDHSTDESMHYAHEVAKDMKRLSIINNKGKGKKQALKTGIAKAQHELVVTIDADCIPIISWLGTIVDFYEKKRADLIVCPIKVEESEQLFANFQQYEMSSLVGSGGGAIGSGMPILCNGANLAFTKKIWVKNQPQLQYQEASGDDIYLLQSVAREGGDIQFLKSPKSMVITQAQRSIKAFLRQHARWMGKKAALADKNYLFTALTVYTTSILILLHLLLLPFYPDLWYGLVLIFSLKLTIDTLFFLQIKSFFGLKNILFKTLIYSLIYPLYVLTTSITSITSLTLKCRQSARW